MGSMLATGGSVPFPPRSGRIDLFPLLTVVLALVAVRLMLGIRLRWPVVVGVAIGGTALGWAIEAWGFAVPTAVALVIGLLASSVLHRQARRGDARA
jgi:hypothetical protein